MPLALSKCVNATFAPFHTEDGIALCLIAMIFFILVRLYA
jgi:hypothetical protein